MIPPIANKFVAGESIPAVLDHVATLERDGINAIVNLLGEHHDDPAVAREDTETYLELIEEIGSGTLEACISVKPTQIGLEISADEFEANVDRIIEAAVSHDVFVWIDMEDHTTTDATLEAYERVAHEYVRLQAAESASGTESSWSLGGVGVCLQANLKRTRDDLERLNTVPGKVRLVKGAYDEPKSIAYKKKDRVDEAYRTLLADAFEHRDGGIAIGSHDPAMIEYARELHEQYGTPYEVQMLTGVRTQAQRDLARDGVTVYQYVPYGSRWFLYFYRRVRERKENLLFAARAVISS